MGSDAPADEGSQYCLRLPHWSANVVSFDVGISMTAHPEFSRECSHAYSSAPGGRDVKLSKQCSAEKSAMVDRLAYQAKELESYEVTTDEMAMRIEELEKANKLAQTFFVVDEEADARIEKLLEWRKQDATTFDLGCADKQKPFSACPYHGQDFKDLENQCAAMREALVYIVIGRAQADSEHPLGEYASMASRFIAKAKEALSSTAGRDFEEKIRADEREKEIQVTFRDIKFGIWNSAIEAVAKAAEEHNYCMNAAQIRAMKRGGE